MAEWKHRYGGDDNRNDDDDEDDCPAETIERATTIFSGCGYNFIHNFVLGALVFFFCCCHSGDIVFYGRHSFGASRGGGYQGVVGIWLPGQMSHDAHRSKFYWRRANSRMRTRIGTVTWIRIVRGLLFKSKIAFSAEAVHSGK